jgi:DNA-binding NarL/FixJ family response regulator
LGISVETVKEHVQNILRKLEASDRTEAAVWAVKRGLA